MVAVLVDAYHEVFFLRVQRISWNFQVLRELTIGDLSRRRSQSFLRGVGVEDSVFRNLGVFQDIEIHLFAV